MTNTLLSLTTALGKFNEKRVPELFSAIGPRKALIWNLRYGAASLVCSPIARNDPSPTAGNPFTP